MPIPFAVPAGMMAVKIAGKWILKKIAKRTARQKVLSAEIKKKLKKKAEKVGRKNAKKEAHQPEGPKTKMSRQSGGNRQAERPISGKLTKALNKRVDIDGYKKSSAYNKRRAIDPEDRIKSKVMELIDEKTMNPKNFAIQKKANIRNAPARLARKQEQNAAKGEKELDKLKQEIKEGQQKRRRKRKLKQDAKRRRN
jgi:hypothetical protein|tara:strand:+ start:43 stop:630 length:588 start_codon:yes stop_codon:yes gene_type:complete